MQGPPTAFGYPLFVKSLIPGLLLLCSLMPLVDPGPVDHIFGWQVKFPEVIAVFVLTAFFLGFLLSLFDRGIYEFYEGRRFWPRWLKRRMVRRLQKKVDRLIERAKKIRDADSQTYDYIWYVLRTYPLRRVSGSEFDSRPVALLPSRLGNLLESYEQYSYERYGMDGVFYWYRLRMQLGEQARKESDTAGAEADALVYSSFGFLISSFIYFIVGASQSMASLADLSIGGSLPLNANPPVWILLSLFFIAVSYTLYRFSIPLHRSYGQYFKSMFDLGRKKLWEGMKPGTTKPSPTSEDWQDLYHQLAYLESPQEGEAASEEGTS
jgi:hypothetical protein